MNLDPESLGTGDVNPYAATFIDPDASATPIGLHVPAWIAIVCCATSLMLLLLGLVVSLPHDTPNAPSETGVFEYFGALMIAPAIGLAGAISMLYRKRYRLSIAGAICLLIPIWGPCFGLTLPIGIWLLVLLRQQSIRDSFPQPPRPHLDANDYVDVEDALAAAFQLDRTGEWENAIMLFKSIAERWPEHATYVENCIRGIRTKQSVAPSSKEMSVDPQP